MTGLYLHIPFCRRACHYCDFHFSTSLKTYEGVMSAMQTELSYWSDAWQAPLQTVYLGGGTPSMVELADLRKIFEMIRDKYQLEPAAEVTLEANPEDITDEKLEAWREIGINRLSIGIQSFFDDELRWMNRNHSAEASRNAIRLAQEHGFENLTVDLIYGVPVSSDERWAGNVRHVIEAGVPHVSAYALTVEERTALAHAVNKGSAAAPDEEQSHRQFMLLRSELIRNGFEPYEISNFGKPGWHSVHNSNYWNGVPYLGIGPGAHSFDGDIRRWNVRNNALYVKKAEAGEVWYETEQLSPKDRYNEIVMTGMRRQHGISLEEIKVRFGDELALHLRTEARPHIEAGTACWEGDRLKLTERGLFFADGIASDLFAL